MEMMRVLESRTEVAGRVGRDREKGNGFVGATRVEVRIALCSRCCLSLFLEGRAREEVG